MPVTDELPPLAAQVVRTLGQTYDRRGLEAFDEEAAKVLYVVGFIIAQVCGRERFAEAMERLEAALTVEGIGEPKDSDLTSIH